MNLIIGDYFKAESIFVQHSKMACKLISWLRSKTYILARLREVQIQNGKAPLTVICAVLTRWTAHYLVFSRLLELELPLHFLVTQDAIAPPGQQSLISLGSSAANRRKAREMVAIIKDISFWHSLARYDAYLSRDLEH